ncbi:S8 family serine peptidase [bacterium]|nr:S8 family serine peptidase [bacterium]
MKKIIILTALTSFSIFADPGLIMLEKATIDPTVPTVNNKASVCSPSTFGTSLYIVQPEVNFTAEERREAEKLGIIFRGNIPPNAYLVEASEKDLAVLKEKFSLLYAGEYLPEYKLLYPGADEASVNAVGEEISYPVKVGTFRKECLPDIVKALEALGAPDIAEVSGTLEPCVRTKLTNSEANEIAKRGDVAFIEPYALAKPLNDVAKSGKLANLEDLQLAGYTGKGQIVCIQDTGLDNGDIANIHPDFKDKTIIGRATTEVALERGSYDDWGDNDEHGTHVCGSAVGTGAASGGQYRGMAPDASLFILAAGRSDGYIGVGNKADLTNTYHSGCRVMNNSWGITSDGYYSSEARLYDFLIWAYKDYTVCFSAGNENRKMTIPVDSTMNEASSAKNVITVGAAENYRPEQGEDAKPDDGEHQGMAWFSSRGPCRDGRIKPDVVAPGTYIVSTLSSTEKTSVREDYYCFMSGTSMASPITAGCCAVIRDYLKQKYGIASASAALVKAILVTGARTLLPGQYKDEFPDARPNPVEGHGHINIKGSLEPTDGKMFFDEFTLTKTGQAVTNVYHKDAQCDLNVGLVWSDYPGSTGASKVLVNDLDLYVIDPNGIKHSLHDHLNNVEVLHIYDCAPGDYKLIVKANNVMQGPQPCALVFHYRAGERTTGKGYYTFKPLDWKGTLSFSLKGSLGIKGFSAVQTTGYMGIFNNAKDVFVGLRFNPKKVKNKITVKDKTFSFTYSTKNDKFSYRDKCSTNQISFLTYDGSMTYYTPPDKASIKGKGTMLGDFKNEFNEESEITLINSKEDRTIIVGDSLVRGEDKGNKIVYSGVSKDGNTAVKASVKKKNGKFNFKMKVTSPGDGANLPSLMPALSVLVLDNSAE